MKFIIWLCYFITENSYFGWNFLPKSEAEMIADGIGLILLFLCFLE